MVSKPHHESLPLHPLPQHLRVATELERAPGVAAPDRLVDELIAAKRAGDFGRMQQIGERVLRGAAAAESPDDRATATTNAPHGVAAPKAPAMSPLAQYDRVAKSAYDTAVAETRVALAKSFSSPTAPESILLDLVARELPITLSLLDAQQKLASRLTLGPVLENPSWVRALARALHDVTVVQNSISRRVEGLLGATANLRAQRRLLGGHDDK